MRFLHFEGRESTPEAKKVEKRLDREFAYKLLFFRTCELDKAKAACSSYGAAVVKEMRLVGGLMLVCVLHRAKDSNHSKAVSSRGDML